MRQQSQKNNDSGFVDVAANALAIVILVTMIALLLASVPQRRGEVISNDTPALSFPVALDPTRAPLNTYWYVSDSGLTEVVFDDVAKALADGETTVRTELMTAYFQNARSGYRDLDEYRLDIRPNLTALRDAAQPMDTAKISALVERLTQAFEADTQVPTFLVMPYGYDQFAQFYAHLRQTDIALRWRPVSEEGVAVLLRAVTQFETGIASWR